MLSDGRVVPATNLFDAEGDETADPAEAVTFVAGADRDWFCCPCEGYAAAAPH